MGRKRRKYDTEERAASSKKKTKNESIVKPQIELDFDVDESKYDEANAILLTDKNLPKKENKVRGKTQPVRILSKKQKKKLELILKRRQKKSDRQQLLEELTKHQVTQDELKQMVSISKVQTKGIKQIDEKVKGSESKPLNLDEIAQSSESSDDEELENEGAKGEPDFSAYKVNSSQVDSEEEEEEEHEEPQTNKIDEMPPEPLKVASTTKKDFREPSVFIPVNRTPENTDQRMKLPILAEEQAIMEAIKYNDVSIICGETGSGKTTQLPQFLYEAGYAQEKLICVTEPRRVAAMAMSKRVAEEMSLSTRQVSYHIRYEGNVTKETKIKFVTDGVLLREVQEDFLLSNYSVVIIDEAHERSVFSDILMGILSRIVPLRRKKLDPLKLIIMSATLRVDDFAKNARLFSPEPPVLRVEARQFPVTIHFSKVTPDNHINAAFTKICKVHRSQPSGGILVFVTGRNEVNTLCRKLKKAFPAVKVNQDNDESNPIDPSEEVAKAKKRSKKIRQSNKPKKVGDLLPSINLDDFSTDGQAPLVAGVDEESDVESAPDSDDEIDSLHSSTVDSTCEPLYCLPLYSMLPKHRQDAVFKKPPQGYRLCVVTTNVAETSLTIPDIKYVIDTGKVKNKLYDKVTGVSAFVTSWCSKASADQRAGRAGRTSPGHCYRLYSSAVFNNDFSQFSQPEILIKPVDDLVLQLISLNINNVINFPFPTAPEKEALIASEKRLLMMGALEEIKSSVSVSGVKSKQLTQLGRVMAKFPLNPRYSKMLAYSYPQLFPFVIALVAGLTVQEIFLSDPITDSDGQDAESKGLKKKANKWREQKNKWAGSGNSHLLGDLMVLLKAIGASEFAGNTINFCAKFGILHKSMVEVHKLRKQLTYEVQQVTSFNHQIDMTLEPPDEIHSLHLRQIATAGFFDHVAR